MNPEEFVGSIIDESLPLFFPLNGREMRLRADAVKVAQFRMTEADFTHNLVELMGAPVLHWEGIFHIRSGAFCRTLSGLSAGLRDWIATRDADVFDVFPAQELVSVAGDGERIVEKWKQVRPVSGRRMIALKNDRIWAELSDWGLPFPPFEVGSLLWVKDVDRSDAESLGLLQPAEVIEPDSGFDFSFERYRESVAHWIASLASKPER